MTQENKKRLLQYGILLLIIAFFIFTFFIYNDSVFHIITNTSERFSNENSKLYSGLINNQLNQSMDEIQYTAGIFSKSDLSSEEKIKAAIAKFNRFPDLPSVIYASADGTVYENKGNSINNVSKRVYFQKCRDENKTQISQYALRDAEGIPSLILAAPVVKNGRFEGIIAGAVHLSLIEKNISADTLGTSGYFMIIRKDGLVVLGNSSPNRLCYEINLFHFFQKTKGLKLEEYNKFSRNIISGKNGILYYNIDGNRRFASYLPLDINDWTMLSIVPQDFLNTQEGNLYRLTMTLIFIILIIVSVFVKLLNSAHKRTLKIQKDNERLQMVTKKNQSIIIEIDFNAKSVSYSGDTEFIFGEKLTKSDLSALNLLAEKVHKEDLNSVNQFQTSVFKEHKDYTAEFRLLTADNEYLWFRISTMTIFDQKHNPLKCIAYFTNVNKEILKEQELQHKAEYDSLSGLLNKSAFENKVRDFLGTNPRGICALFIIDLDNFKATNDTLGHAMGDVAISDTAKKISLIFTIRDYIGRFGGDEFCVFTIFDPVFTEEECMSLLSDKAQSLCDIINEMYFNDQKFVEISASIGIALYPDNGAAFEELFKKADKALYYVKQNGKNNFKFYNPSLTAK